MAIAQLSESIVDLPPLVDGERLDQPTFHERYEAMPPHVRAELIGGKVYIMPSPVSLDHSDPHAWIMRWLFDYEDGTPGIQVTDNATIVLGIASEPQPDATIRILPEYGGRTEVKLIKNKRYVYGAPELIVEISYSTARFDLKQKKTDYERAGVDEYVAVLPEQRRVAWFHLVEGKYRDLRPDEDGILRSRKLPGLWLDTAALLRGDKRRVRDVVQQGLDSRAPGGA